MEAPHTYSEWVSLFKKFGEGVDDKEVMLAMKGGSLEWQAGVADRFAKHFSNALNKRIKTALDRFDENMKRSTDAEEGYIRSLNALGIEFTFIRDAADLPCIPEEYRVQFMELVSNSADQAQQSLEDSALSIDKTERTGRIPSIVRNHAVNRF